MEPRPEIAELRASRERLVRGADAELRAIERALHQGVQQQLAALAVNLQLARVLADADPAAAKALIEEMERDVEGALEETARLARRIFPPLLEASGLAPALRSTAASLGIRVSVDVDADPGCPEDALSTVYRCCLAILEHAGEGARMSIGVRQTPGALAFDIVADDASDVSGDELRDRIEALGGRLSTRPGRVSASLPLSEGP